MTALRDMPAIVYPVLDVQGHITLSRFYQEDEQMHPISILKVSPGPPSRLISLRGRVLPAQDEPPQASTQSLLSCRVSLEQQFSAYGPRPLWVT